MPNDDTKIDAAAQAAAKTAADKGLVEVNDSRVLNMFSDNTEVDDDTEVSHPAPQSAAATTARPISSVSTAPSPVAVPVTPTAPVAAEPTVDDTDSDEVILMGIDPATGALKTSEAKKTEATADVAAPDALADEEKLSPEERRRLWQSNYNKEREARIRAEAMLEAAKQTPSAVPATPVQQAPSPVAAAPVVQTTFSKTPLDFMPQDEEYNPYDAADPRTPSGSAYGRWLGARDAHLVSSVKSDILSTLTAERQQTDQVDFLNRQITHLKSKRPQMTDDEIRGTLEWAFKPREDNLYILQLAKELSEGRLPISRKTLGQLASTFRPNGNGKGSVVSITEGSKAPVDADSEQLSELAMFADSGNITL